MTTLKDRTRQRTVVYDVSQFPGQSDFLHEVVRQKLRDALRRASVVKVYRGKKLIARIGKTGMKGWKLGREVYDHRGTYWLHSRWKRYKRLDALARCIADWR
jgi:hypothetical protein